MRPVKNHGGKFGKTSINKTDIKNKMSPMKTNIFTIIIVILVSLISCKQVDPNNNIDEGKVEGNFYTSNEIGWTIEIPKGWKVIDLEKVKAMNEKGRKALEETIEGEIDYNGLKNLIGFQKNQFNIFQSSSEPFKLEYEGEWEEKNSVLKNIVYSTYLNQGVKVDSSSTSIETIDGLNFQTFSFTFYTPQGEVLFKQVMYSRLINGYDFGVNMNYNNDKDRDELLSVFRNSKFKKK
jgi:hypothetical protein